VRELKWCEDA